MKDPYAATKAIQQQPAKDIKKLVDDLGDSNNYRYPTATDPADSERAKKTLSSRRKE